ncbi:MAG: M23 family metallopeptidase [Burkholderiaceae bacterium]|nr:M23 family metallopeptidase [Burkholderiaceae bacterium]
MQVLITHGSIARTRVLHLSRWQLALAAVALVALLLAVSGSVYHFVFLKAAREGWPVVAPLVRLIVRDEIAQRERFMRDNLDAIAQRVGEMQAKLVKLESMGDRVAGLAGLRSDELRTAPPAAAPTSARGGPFVPAQRASLTPLQMGVERLGEATDWQTDVFTWYESRLQERRLAALLVPSQPPVDVPANSGFGFRTDPFTGRPALHTGLDFPAEPGAPIVAAAGGLVVAREWHPAYGNLLEIDHGNGLLTRYAHAQSLDVPLGALVRRGQRIATVGNTGRSTGPHLHFEVLVDGVLQDPARFLAGGSGVPALRMAPAPFAQPPRPTTARATGATAAAGPGR